MLIASESEVITKDPGFAVPTPNLQRLETDLQLRCPVMASDLSRHVHTTNTQ